tara:strand:- start:3718 stop:5658 length:1941 start_codon:yes stop_codon:yes gene_type:complete
MATFYKYAERKKTNQIDWNKISSDINKNMAAIEEAKASRRAADQKALNESLTRLMEKPVGEDLAENQRIANYTQQAEEILLNDLRSLKRGDINRRDYNLKYNNVKMGTERAFSLSKQYQDSYQMHMDRLKADKDGKILASNLEGEMLGKLEQYGIASGSQYYINPITGDVSLALVTGEGKEGDVTIGDSQFDLMGLGTAQNIIFQKIDKYQTQDQVKNIAENLKTTAIDELDPSGFKGYITSTKGLDIDALFEIKEGILTAKKGSDGEALLSQINATFAGNPFSKASFLSDTVGTIDGKVVEMVFPDAQGNFVDTGNHQIRMKLDKQGRYVPEITDEQQKIIDKNMVALVKNSIDKEFKIKADTRLTDAQRFDIGQINRKLAEQKDSLRLSMDTISELYKGGEVDLEVATTYFKGIEPGIRKVERNDDGLILTVEDDLGNIRTETVSFFAKDAKGNPDITKPLTERDFILAASNLLLGGEKTQTKEFKQLIDSRNDEGKFVYGGKTRSTGKATAGEGVSRTGRTTFNISTNRYIDTKLKSGKLDFDKGLPFGKQDNDLAKELEAEFTDLGLKAEATGGLSNEVFVTVPGVEERVIIDANNYTPSGVRKEKEKLKKFLLVAIKKLGLEEKLNLEPDPLRGRTSQYNK